MKNLILILAISFIGLSACHKKNDDPQPQCTDSSGNPIPCGSAVSNNRKITINNTTSMAFTISYTINSILYTYTLNSYSVFTKTQDMTGLSNITVNAHNSGFDYNYTWSTSQDNFYTIN